MALVISAIDDRSSSRGLVDHIPQRLAEEGAAAGLGAFDAHVAKAFDAVEGVVGVQNHAIVGRMFWVAPGDDQRMVGGGRFNWQDVDSSAGESAAGDGG